MIAIAGLTGGGVIYTKGNLRIMFDKFPSKVFTIRHEKLIEAIESRTILSFDDVSLLTFPNREIATISIGEKVVNLDWEIFLNKLRG